MSLTQALSNVEVDVFRLLKELYGVEKTKVTEEDRMVTLENARKDQYWRRRWWKGSGGL
jgi:hypothetical protein